jgi:hypothetical protein
MCVTNHLVFLCSEEALACIQLAIKDDAVSVLCFLLVFIRKKLYLSFEVFTARLRWLASGMLRLTLESIG